jgi:hypothetical protein
MTTGSHNCTRRGYRLATGSPTSCPASDDDRSQAVAADRQTAKDPVKLRRAIVVLMSAQGQSTPDIAHLLDCSPEYARGVIHGFNESGFAAGSSEAGRCR